MRRKQMTIKSESANENRLVAMRMQWMYVKIRIWKITDSERVYSCGKKTIILYSEFCVTCTATLNGQINIIIYWSSVQLFRLLHLSSSSRDFLSKLKLNISESYGVTCNLNTHKLSSFLGFGKNMAGIRFFSVWVLQLSYKWDATSVFVIYQTSKVLLSRKLIDSQIKRWQPYGR